MSSKTKKTRREFLSDAGGAAAGAVLGSLVSGCGETVAAPEPDDNGETTYDPVRAVIGGPNELQIPSLYESVRGTFDGSESIGPYTKTYSWSIVDNDDGFGEGELEVGQDETAIHDFTRAGVYTVKLKVNNTWRVEDDAEHTTRVSLQSLPGGDYHSIAFFVFEETSPGYGNRAIYLMNPSTRETTRLIAGNRINSQRLNWEPSGERLLVSLGRGTDSVHTYNLLTGELLRISPNASGLCWAASWNPKKDWVVYCDDEREPTNDEFSLVRPDGSEHFYLHPEFSSRLWGGMYPTWHPDGERFAASHSRFEIDGELVSRVGIFDDIWGTPTRSYIPTEDQISNLLEKYAGGSDTLLAEFHNTFTIGMGAAWAPDGERIAYSIWFGFTPNQHQLLVTSRVDGTGEIEEIVLDKNSEGEIHPTGHTTWAPDGQFLIFDGFDHGYTTRKLFKYTPGQTRVTVFYDALEASRVTWYG